MTTPGTRAIRWAALAVTLVVAMASWPLRADAQGAAPSASVERLNAAWESSLALERTHEIAKARTVLLEAFGPTPATFYPCLRLAWLNLLLKDAAASTSLYRRAATLPGATAEARQGLVLALTQTGYQALARGNNGAARRAWEEALALDPSAADARYGLDLVGRTNGATPELWVARMGATTGSSSGDIVYAQVPVRITSGINLRGAYRHIGWPTGGSTTMDPATGTTTTTSAYFGTQDEVYGAVAVETGVATTEVTGFELWNADEHIPGFGAASRIGGTYGVSVMAVGMKRSSGWNVQVAPEAFAWLSPALAVSGGIRHTRDPLLSATSVLVGATVRHRSVEVDGGVHIGTERWAFGAAGPTVLSFADSTSAGGTATVSLALSKTWGVSVQGQVERLRAVDTGAAAGTYSTVALGVRWMPWRVR
jgi:hypothetical protein